MLFPCAAAAILMKRKKCLLVQKVYIKTTQPLYLESTEPKRTQMQRLYEVIHDQAQIQTA